METKGRGDSGTVARKKKRRGRAMRKKREVKMRRMIRSIRCD